MKHLLALVILLLVCLPILAQDATEAATVEANPVTVIDGTGEGNTIVNVGGEAPAETPAQPETPVEAMPWWAFAALEIGKYAGLFAVLMRAIREAAKAFMARPGNVSSAENAVNLLRSLLPDVLEQAAQKGAERMKEETQATIEELRRVITELTDGVPAASKVATSPSSSVSSTGGSFDSSQSRIP
jgi:hypothetical protein